MKDAPNLFSFATSELSQDAVLAYILSWADKSFADAPEYRAVHSLGKVLLGQFVASAAEANKCPDPLAERASLNVSVLTQHKRVDVLVKIDDDIALIVEDKTDTGEHGGQIKAYVDAILKEDKERSEPRKVLAVYVKTGNEASGRAKKSTACGIQMRKDLLDALAQVPGTGDTIVENFREHLQALDADTMSYLTRKVDSWTWRAIEGFYLHLDDNLTDPEGSWCSINPPTGRFLGYWWNVQHKEGYVIYLQMHVKPQEGDKPKRDERRLTVRASVEGPDKITTHGQYAILKACQRAAKALPDSEIKIEKAGTFRGGDSAAVADITFGADGESFLASDFEGVLDMPKTMARLAQAMDFVDRVASAPIKVS